MEKFKLPDLPVEVQAALINAARDIATSKIAAKGGKFDNYTGRKCWFKESLKEVCEAYSEE